MATDAFGRQRVSNPFTLFDSSHRYKDNGLWNTSIASGGSAVFSVNEGLVNLNVDTTSGSEVLRETSKVFSYQPGKSLLVMNTFVMAPAQNRLRQRVGYFGRDNGLYIQLNNTTLSFVKRSSVTGVLVETVVPQSSWNVDKMDGSGPSGVILGVSRAILRPSWAILGSRCSRKRKIVISEGMLKVLDTVLGILGPSRGHLGTNGGPS
jgi:hypothetical protein